MEQMGHLSHKVLAEYSLRLGLQVTGKKAFQVVDLTYLLIPFGGQ